MSVAYDLSDVGLDGSTALGATVPAPHRGVAADGVRLRLVAPAGARPGSAGDLRQARPGVGREPVTVLHPPRSVAPPVHLTRRGVVVLALAVVALGVALVWAAAASAPSARAGSSVVASTVSASSVMVRPGDTLWSIATRVAPQRDPRAEVWTLQQVNHLRGVEVQPGQVLRLH